MSAHGQQALVWTDLEPDGDLERAWPKDRICTLLTLYWVTSSIGTSFVSYFDPVQDPDRPWQPTNVPAAFALFPRNITPAPREWAERGYSNIVRWTDMPRGGHFPSIEAVDDLAADIGNSTGQTCDPSARRTSSMPIRTVVEHGPKDKRSVAFALDWPGWNRGAKSAEVALETLESYRDRYRAIADLAGMAREFEAAGPLEVVEDRVGPGSVDFWGISFSPSSTEHGPMDEAELERKLTLLQAAWAYFDGVAARVSPEMRKGPRGGGRDRDRIIRHVIRNESEEFAKQVGLRIPEEAALTPDGLRHHRETYVAAMRAYNAGEVAKPMRSWSLPFLIRHSAFHTLDHAWEMEDKDLTCEVEA